VNFTYGARERRVSKKDLPVVLQTLEEITKGRGKKRLTTAEQAKALVDKSRSASSPTHHLFEWDDKKAAERQRLDHAMDIIMSIEVTIDEQPPMRGYVPVLLDDKRGYYPMLKVLENKDLITAHVAEAKEDLARWKRRYENLRHVAELSGVFVAIESATEPGKKKVG
jgi:hypothetical protein